MNEAAKHTTRAEVTEEESVSANEHEEQVKVESENGCGHAQAESGCDYAPT